MIDKNLKKFDKDIKNKNKNDKNIKNKDIESKAKSKKNVREVFTHVLELPKDVVMNIPRMTMVGFKDLLLENFKGIIEYEAEVIRINTNAGIIKVTGTNLIIKEITSDDLLISGNIESLQFN